MYNFISSACVSRNLKCYDFYVNGLYELYVNRVREKILKDLLPVDGVVFDVGARIGAWTLPAITLGNMTYSFEPVYESFKQLQANISLNNYDDYAFPVNVAVADIDGVKPFSYSNNPSKALQLSKAAISDKETGTYVQTITLDSFVQSNHIDQVDFIKIDVEGQELAVIDGAVNLISTMVPDMVVENHDDGRIGQVIERVNELAQYRVVKNIKSDNHMIDHTSHTIFLY